MSELIAAATISSKCSTQEMGGFSDLTLQLVVSTVLVHHKTSGGIKDSTR
jgi:hypothetical protein